MGSNYFTITPEMVAPVEAASAAAAGNYGAFQVAADTEQKVGIHLFRLGFELERELSVVIIEML